MQQLLNFIFQNFWIWAGSMILLYILVNGSIKLLNMFLWHKTLRKCGYPPSPHYTIEGLPSPIKEDDPGDYE